MSKPLPLALLTLLCVSCGGGGGGGGGPRFAGTWNFVGLKFVDDCNTAAPGDITGTWIVNQDGNRVVLQYGSLGFDGEVNDEGDGYDVATDALPIPGGCTGTAAISVANVSGDEGSGVIVFFKTCPGSRRICSQAYAGPLERDTTRSARVPDGDDPEELFDAPAAQAAE